MAIKTVAQWIIRLEPLVLVIITFAFWYPSPTRDRWLWLLALLLPIYAARWLLHRRLWTRTPLDIFLLAFLVLGVINVYTAPYTRGLLMLGRPLLGMALYVYCVEYARTHGNLDGLLIATILLTLLVGILSLISTQWVGKSSQLSFVTDLLPRIDVLPGAYTTFNPNEIAGALAWLCPLAAGLMLYRWKGWLPRLGVILAFILMFTGLFLGQSRFALAGVLVALVLLIFLLVPSRRWRYVLLALVGVVALIELALIFNLFSAVQSDSELSLSQRDESSFSKRFGIWESALQIIRDYPLTGVGMSMYRHPAVRQRYPAPGQPNPPHAHDEWLQVGTDLGLPGLAVYIAWHVVVALMLWRSWRQGDASARVVAASVAGGLLAHAAFGLGDAITLWDRFIFVFWWLFGLAGAQYILVRDRQIV